MSFELKRYLQTEDQNNLQAMIRDFAIKEIIPTCKEADRTGEFPLELVKKGMEMGLHLVALPEKYGGLGFDYKTIAVVKEEMAYGDAGFATTMGACMLASLPVKVAGNDYHWKKVSDVLTSNGLTSFALTEANSGSDAAGIRTKAEKVGDEYILNGSKCFITNAEYSKLFTVVAITDPSKGIKGMSAFLVDADTTGLSVGKEEDKMGCRTSNTCDVIFEDVHVPAKNMLGAEGEGFMIAMKTLGYARCTAGAAPIGNAKFALEKAIEYADQRVIFGKPISKMPTIQHMVADSYMRLEAARSLVRYACDLVDHGIIDAAISASSKAFASDANMQICTDCVQIMGGYGYSREYPLEKRMRDAKITQIWEGTNQVLRSVAGGALFAKLK